MVARRCSAKHFSKKFHKTHREIPLLQSLSNTVKGLQTVRLVTLLERDHGTSVSEPAVCRSSTK